MALGVVILGPLLSAVLSAFLLFCGESALAQQTGSSSPGAIRYPLGDFNLNSRPDIRWTCSEGHTEANVSLIDTRSGSSIFESPWARFNNRGNVCSGPILGRIITPPFPKPTPCRGPGCITVGPPKYSGLELGQFEATLKLRGPGVADLSAKASFNIVNNIYSDFSLNADGWQPLSGNWKVMGGSYTASGNSQGSPWITSFNGPVFKGVAGSTFRDGRRFDARFFPSCQNDRCYGGIIPYITELGATGGVTRYLRSEVVVSGNGKLFIRGVADGSPPGVETIVNGSDVSSLTAGKASYILTVHQASTDAVWSSMAVYIDGRLAYCGRGPHGPAYGRSGIVFSSYEANDAIKIDDFSVSPTRYAGMSTLCRDQIPP